MDAQSALRELRELRESKPNEAWLKCWGGGGGGGVGSFERNKLKVTVTETGTRTQTQREVFGSKHTKNLRVIFSLVDILSATTLADILGEAAKKNCQTLIRFH
jgi:hypothetical protein